MAIGIATTVYLYLGHRDWRTFLLLTTAMNMSVGRARVEELKLAVAVLEKKVGVDDQ